MFVQGLKRLRLHGIRLGGIQLHSLKLKSFQGLCLNITTQGVPLFGDFTEIQNGFPDDYTLIEYRGKAACDGPRYKSIGNSMAVNVMSWIGQRIGAVEKQITKGATA